MAFLSPCRISSQWGDILRVIGTRRVGDLEMSAVVSGSQLNHYFFERVFLVSEALTKFAVETMGGARPVTELVKFSAVSGFRSEL